MMMMMIIMMMMVMTNKRIINMTIKAVMTMSMMMMTQVEGLERELAEARLMVVQLEGDWGRLEAAFTSLQRKYQEKTDRLEKCLAKSD